MTAAVLLEQQDPFEWLARLGPKLVSRQEVIELWQRYYDGDHDLPTGPSQVKDAYRNFQKTARTNLCELAVESMVDRLEVIGYRNKEGLDEEVWGLWNIARLSGRQSAIYRKALSLGSAYAIVGVDPNRARTPRVTIEDPRNVIVETDPADPQLRIAALRLWHDDIRKRWFATVYLPGWRYHYQTISEFAKPDDPANGRLTFSAEKWEQRSEPTRSTREIPVIVYANSDEGREPMAEFSGAGIDIQNRVNLTVLNRLTAERYGAFRQKALTNYIPQEDPVTGLPISPFNLGSDQVLTVPPAEPGESEPKLFDLAQTDTSNMIRACEQDMRMFAAATRTPVYYLPGGDMTNLSADAIAALDAGHISKIRQRMAQWSDNHGDMLQIMAEVAELDRTITSGEIAWSKPENFHWAVVADYVVKMKGSGVPLPLIMEEIGWSPARIEQLRGEVAAEALLASVTAGTSAGQSGPGATIGPANAGQSRNGNGRAARVNGTPSGQRS